MEATTWLDRQMDNADERPFVGAGAALPLILWVVALLGISGATALQQVPLWAFALLVMSPALLLIAALFLRALVAGTVATIRQRRHIRAR